MLTFFHGQRRKVGATVLMIALAFMVGWIRSETKYDTITVYGQDHSCCIASLYGRIFLQRSGLADANLGPFGELSIEWEQEEAPYYYRMGRSRNHIGRRFNPLVDGVEVERRWDLPPLMFIVGKEGPESVNVFAISYPSIVLPLIIFSAILLLSKPRPRKLPESTKPTDEAQVTDA